MKEHANNNRQSDSPTNTEVAPNVFPEEEEEEVVDCFIKLAIYSRGPSIVDM